MNDSAVQRETHIHTICRVERVGRHGPEELGGHSTPCSPQSSACNRRGDRWNTLFYCEALFQNFRYDLPLILPYHLLLWLRYGVDHAVQLHTASFFTLAHFLSLAQILAYTPGLRHVQTERYEHIQIGTCLHMDTNAHTQACLSHTLFPWAYLMQPWCIHLASSKLSMPAWRHS